MILRRVILVTCVLIALAALLSGCSAVDAISSCGMKLNYTESIPAKGAVHITWGYGHDLSNIYGDALCVETVHGKQCHVRMVGEPPSFTDLCGLAKFGHEVTHAFRSHQ